MGSVLVAPIGDHPVVITAAADALARSGVTITQAHILCPDESLIRVGAEWAGLELNCEVHIHDLPFRDANSEMAAKQYLQRLAQVLLSCEMTGDNVHLLLAGGRKNVSVLTGIVAQFFAGVEQLYHLLDRHEDDPLRRNLFTIDELKNMPDAVREAKMHPPAEGVHLFPLPFPRFSQPTAIRQYLYDPLAQVMPTLPCDEEAEEFYEDIFQQRTSEDLFEVWLSCTAFEQFKELWHNNRNRAEEFRKCFRQMQQPGRLKSQNGMHGTFGNKGATFHFYKRHRTVERPFYYTRPHPIHLYPEKEVRQVVVSGLSVEQANGQYDPPVKEWLSHIDLEPKYRLSDLPTVPRNRRIVLLAPLGDTPMVASQAYVLLQQEANVIAVELLHPGEHNKNTTMARTLADDFRKEGISCNRRPISGLRDVASTADCEIYLRAIAQTITELQQQSPDTEVHLLLSGGRKSMATLNLFAAQRAGFSLVWHTLVKDYALEQRLEEELRQASSPTKRRDILFLRQYRPEKFALFAVPVFPSAGQA
jgi:hypothetical protein